MMIINVLFFMILCVISLNTTNFNGVIMASFEGKGTLILEKYDTANTSLGYGTAEELQFPIGSNTKLFTAVSLYQLQEKGILNISDDISSYLDQDDFSRFGFPNISHYCPKLLGDDECQKITFRNLLSMGSGIVDAWNCDYSSTSPFVKYCHPFEAEGNGFYEYQDSMAYYVAQFINSPLVFSPGSNYSYSNPNFVLGAYLLQKLSGQFFGAYVQEHILDVIGMSSTFYDPWMGVYGSHPHQVNEYYSYYDSSEPSQPISVGVCHDELNLGGVGGTGGSVSTSVDMHKWYLELFGENRGSKLFSDPKTIYEIVAQVNPVFNNPKIQDGFYAQGVAVWYKNPTDSWPGLIMYEGGSKCSDTAIMHVPDKKLLVSAFSNTPRIYLKGGYELLNKISMEEGGMKLYNEAMNNGEVVVDDGGA